MTTLVLAEREAAQIAHVARAREETGGVLLATPMRESEGRVRLLARELLLVPEAFYRERESDRMSIASEGYVPALAIAERLGAVPIWFHTHPGVGSSPLPSAKDVIVNGELAPLFRLRANSRYYGSLIVSPTAATLAFSGTLETEEKVTPLRHLWCIGEDWRLLRAADGGGSELSAAYDRNIRALGSGVQAALGELFVAIIGCGGTGSSVAEQLVRLGVRHLLLVDPDDLSSTNVTRVYGSTPSDVGTPKAHVLRSHLERIAPDLRCEALVSRITVEVTARRLVGPDLIFGCTDDNAGRLVLSRAANYLLTPVIDVGVLLSSDDAGRLVGIDGRVTILRPGVACLVCRERIDLTRAAIEQLAAEEQQRLRAEGYAPALPGVEPAVVAFTTAVAAAAVGELLERLVGYGPRPRPGEILLRLHEREISTNHAEPNAGHYCDVAAGKLGDGAVQPFLEQTWADA
jgi:molybdopterin/thiamine biosynthesis adenylyltransferase